MRQKADVVESYARKIWNYKIFLIVLENALGYKMDASERSFPLFFSQQC